MILNSPANPTGGIVERELNAEIARVLAGHSLLDPLRRGLLGAALRRRARHDRRARGPARPDDPARRLLEDVRDDGLASRLRVRCPQPLVEPITRLLINSVSCTRAGGAARGRRRARRARATRSTRCAAEFRAPPRRGRRRPEPPARRLAASTPRGAFYAFPNSRRRASARRSSPTGCSTKRASRCSPAPRSAPTARATCGSRTPTRSRTSSGRSLRWASLLEASGVTGIATSLREAADLEPEPLRGRPRRRSAPTSRAAAHVGRRLRPLRGAEVRRVRLRPRAGAPPRWRGRRRRARGLAVPDALALREAGAAHCRSCFTPAPSSPPARRGRRADRARRRPRSTSTRRSASRATRPSELPVFLKVDVGQRRLGVEPRELRGSRSRSPGCRT